MVKDKIKLLYIASNPYSGSTLLTFLLGSHPSIATVGELSGPDPRIPKEKYICSCGARIKDCDFWHDLENRMVQRGISFSIFDQDKRWKMFGNRYVHHVLTMPFADPIIDSLQSAIFGIGRILSANIKKHVHINVAVIKEILELTKKDVFLDSSKDVDRLQILRREPQFDIYVLHLVRDGRGQTYSQVKRGRSMEQVAKSLCRFDDRVSRLARLLYNKNRYLRIKYEDLCEMPLEQLKIIASFVGIDPMHFHFNAFGTKQNMHILGNSMCLQFTGKIAIDFSWKAGLSDEQLKAFQRIAGYRNSNYGYCENI